MAIIRTDFARPLRIELVARAAGMNPSAFHQHFRKMTSLTPLGFQKQLRLIEARRIMMADGVAIASAAHGDGYESIPQFTREYGRMFGVPPGHDMRAVKQRAHAAMLASARARSAASGQKPQCDSVAHAREPNNQGSVERKIEAMTIATHKLHLADRVVMLAMRGVLAVSDKPASSPEARPGFDEMIVKVAPADRVEYEAAEIGGVSGWWCRPADAIPGAAILYLHGGAYILGSASAYRNFAGQIAARAGVATFVADYGLAPERPFPAAFDDALAAYEGLENAGYDAIAIVGDSAGGGLALALLTAAAGRPKGGKAKPPAGAVVMSPWLDLTLSGETMTTRAGSDPLLTRDTLAQASALYLGAADPRDPRASALFGPLFGLPPVTIHVGDDEILLDDALRYAREVEATGGSADVHVWKGMVHVFPTNSLLKAAREALDQIGASLRTGFESKQ